MTTATPTQRYARFYDQVLGEIERGNTDQGLNLLVGMLDGIHMQGCQLAPARAALAGHMLHQLLLEAPLYRPGGHGFGASDTPDMPPMSPTGSNLTKASNRLAIMRALRDRRHFADQWIARAWRDGLKICLVGDDGAIGDGVLHGRDQANVTKIDNQLARLPQHTAEPGAAFDLFCAPGLADTADAAALRQRLTALRRALAPTGTAILSALLPHHMGAGWARACLDWHPHVHAEPALLRLAADAGFSAQFCNDESNCLVWCVLRPAPAIQQRGI